MSTAAYLRLSREDGDKAESDSIANQRAYLSNYIAGKSDLSPPEFYIDDGCTGTNFDRPDFRRMAEDIESGKIDCVVVKDLSRFGRDYIETGRYLERWLPERGVRFIAVNDGIDSGKAAYDMLLPLKNVFNAQYAKDISQKVKTSIKAKQQRGDFIGAFSCYGYSKAPNDHSRLVIDPPAAAVVRRIFSLFEAGMGKLAIARRLNDEGIPCPSEYKHLCGEKYHNGQRLEGTVYWTYATVHRILKTQTYIGNMEQGRNYRPTMHGKAKKLDKEDWVVVVGTHEPIIPIEQWSRVQALLEKNARCPDFEHSVSPFAGYLKCGDCGRAMAKAGGKDDVHYCCGSYKRYGAKVCSKHGISQKVLENVVLGDLNRIIADIPDLQSLIQSAEKNHARREPGIARHDKLLSEIGRLKRLKKSVYEDYREGLLSREEYDDYKADYEARYAALSAQLEAAGKIPADDAGRDCPWLDDLKQYGRLTEFDRITAAQVLDSIKVFENGRVEISYRFSPPQKKSCP